MASNKPRAFNPSSVSEPPPTYSQACVTPIVSSSSLVTLAGQAGIQKDGSVPSGIRAQAKVAYENVLKCLEAAGATPRDIIMVRHYIVKETGDKEQDAKDIVDRGWGEEWMEFMDKNAAGHRPPDTVAGVAVLAKKQLLYECEVTALIS